LLISLACLKLRERYMKTRAALVERAFERHDPRSLHMLVHPNRSLIGPRLQSSISPATLCCDGFVGYPGNMRNTRKKLERENGKLVSIDHAWRWARKAPFGAQAKVFR